MIKGPLKIKRRTLFLYLFPAVFIFIFVIIVPLALSIRYSFFHWSGGPKMNFVGFENYISLLQDEDFWFAFKNNLFLVFTSMTGQLVIPLLLTVVFMSKVLKYKELHRAVIFVPVVLSPIVIGILWSLIYDKDLGLLNWFLQSIGMENLIFNWLDDPKIVMMSITIPLIWQYIGVYLVIFMAALQGIPQSVLEVAELDGAIGLKKLFYIILPLIRSTIGVAIMLCIAGNMKVFDHIYVMTGGGPGKSSTVMAQYAYNKSFEMFKLGYGSAASIGILILSLVLILTSRILGRFDSE